MWRLSSDNDQAHAWLLLPAILWALVRAGNSMPDRSPGAGKINLWWIPILLLSLCWAVAVRGAMSSVGLALWPLVIMACLVGAFGFRRAKPAVLPVALLYLTLPVWDVLVDPLRGLSTAVTTMVLRALDIPAFVEGHRVTLTHGAIEIASGCSGVNFFVAALSLAGVVGLMNRASGRQLARLMTVAAGLALVCNWIRIIVIVIAAHLTEMRTFLITTDHYVFGWLLFALAMAVFCWFAVKPGPESKAATRKGGGVPVMPASMLAALAAAAVGPLLWFRSEFFAAKAGPPAALAQLPQALDRVDASMNVAWRPAFAGAHATDFVLSDRDPDVYVYRAIYFQQQQGAELVGYSSRLIATGDWNTTEHTLPDSVMVAATAPDGAQWRIRYAYLVGNKQTAAARRAQLTYGWQALWARPASAILAVGSPCAHDCAAAERAISARWQASFPWFAAEVAEARTNG